MPKAPAQGKRSTSRPRGNGRREQIIDVATGLFRQKGYHATSLDDIADAIGFTKPAIYYYFKSKDDILFAIIDDIVDQGLRRIQAVASREASATERMHDLLVENTRVILENLNANTVFYNERGLLSAEHERAIRAREREYTKIVEDLYVEGVENGEFIDVDPHIATSTLLGASIWSYRWFDPEGELSIDEIAEGIARILLEGYRV
ncbi:MAG: TetR/AcrR family transcriptional regulator [Thermobifida fusca]|jgi:AcrR family transcriptional regulator|nr:TetR/AcrR family transcriptional regulator [Thermobifida fusca]